MIYLIYVIIFIEMCLIKINLEYKTYENFMYNTKFELYSNTVKIEQTKKNKIHSYLIYVIIILFMILYIYIYKKRIILLYNI